MLCRNFLEAEQLFCRAVIPPRLVVDQVLPDVLASYRGTLPKTAFSDLIAEQGSLEDISEKFVYGRIGIANGLPQSQLPINQGYLLYADRSRIYIDQLLSFKFL